MCGDMLAVAREEFVAADSGKKHSRLLAGLATDQMGSNNRRIGRRFVHVPDKARQEISDIGLNYDPLVVAPKMLSEARGDIGIIQRRFSNPIFLGESDRVGPNWTV